MRKSSHIAGNHRSAQGNMRETLPIFPDTTGVHHKKGMQNGGKHPTLPKDTLFCNKKSYPHFENNNKQKKGYYGDFCSLAFCTAI
jgi:hypothetical protein